MTTTTTTDPWASLDDDVAFAGSTFVIPEGMTLDQAIDVLEDKRIGFEAETEFKRTFAYRPFDGALAAIDVLYETFGIVDGKPIPNWFGETPPSMEMVQVGPEESKQVPWGHFAVAQLERTTIGFHRGEDSETGAPVFFMHVYAPRKYKKIIEMIFEAVEARLKQASIYRGKAFFGGDNISFLDLTGVKPTEVVYADDVNQQLQADVWSLIEHSETMRENGIPLRRAVVLNGGYGTGKTLAGYITAQIAVANGWTFIYCRPGDDVEDAMAMAEQYGPAVVFIEDVDSVVEQDGDLAKLSRTLELFDGLKSKGVEIITIATTNRIEVLPKAMLRPGRLDSVVNIGPLDATGVQRLVRVAIPAANLAEEIDWDQVFEAMQGYLPAFVREAATRATRYSFTRTNSFTTMRISTEDIVAAAQSLRAQHQMMEDAEEMGTRPTLDTVFTDMVRDTIHEVVDGTELHQDGHPTGHRLVSANGSQPGA